MALTFNTNKARHAITVSEEKHGWLLNLAKPKFLSRMRKVHMVTSLLAEYFQPSITCPMQDRVNLEWIGLCAMVFRRCHRHNSLRVI